MTFLFDALYLVLACAYLPLMLWKRKLHRGFIMRLGFLPKAPRPKRPVWIHAVSVGEAMAARSLIAQLRSAHPERHFVFSTVTPTGNKIVQGLAATGDLVIYLPLDLSFIVRRVVKAIDPALFVCVETEIWPNLFGCLQRLAVPIAVVNGRLSERSFRGYSAARLFIRPTLRKVSLFCMQTRRDCQRLQSLGVSDARIRCTGNMKFDVSLRRDSSAGLRPALRQRLGLGVSDRLLVAGSTHIPEEEIVIGAYRNLVARFPDLRLLIAPRHPERAGYVQGLVKRSGFQSLRVSLLKSGISREGTDPFVCILDTVGELADFYEASDIVFMGGSLSRTGGHNILEPAALGRPVIFGPHMFNFRDIAELFMLNRAALMVRSQSELELAVGSLLEDRAALERLAASAQALVRSNQGATLKTFSCIEEVIAGAPVPG